MIRRKLFSFAIVLAVFSTACGQSDFRKRIVLIGDSTVADYSAAEAPLMGWGQALRERLGNDAIVINLAVPGSSTRRFAEKYWDQARATLRANDLLLIQFGHVDASLDASRHTAPDGLYRDLLWKFIKEGRGAGAQPVLITPVARYRFSDGKLVDTHGRYPEVMREVARDSGTALIDLAQLSMLALEKLGEDRAREWFMISYDGHDTSHLSRIGAEAVASIVVTSLDQFGLR